MALRALSDDEVCDLRLNGWRTVIGDAPSFLPEPGADPEVGNQFRVRVNLPPNWVVLQGGSSEPCKELQISRFVRRKTGVDFLLSLRHCVSRRN